MFKLSLPKIAIIIALITLIIVVVSLLIPKPVNLGDGFVLNTLTLGKNEVPGFQIGQTLEDGTVKPLVRGNATEGVTIYGGHASHADLQNGTYSPLSYGEFSIKHNPNLSYRYHGTHGNKTQWTYSSLPNTL